MKNIILIAGLSFLVFSVYAQKEQIDSLMTLPEIEVMASRLVDFTGGQKVNRLDSILLLENKSFDLGQLISRNTSLQINSYSYNGLNTISFRGTSVTHTGFFWNGFKLNPPNVGMMDLSLVPTSYFEDISIYYGGGSSLFGDGSIGGSIHLNNKPDFKKHILTSFRLTAGSFSDYGGQADISMSTGKLYLKTSLLGRTSKNNFEYAALSGETEKLQNAALSRYGIIQDIYYKNSKNLIIGGSVWYQENDKEIPATLTSKPSDAEQQDKSLRTFLKASKSIDDNEFILKTAFFWDELNYADPDPLQELEINSDITTFRSASEFQYRRSINENTRIMSGINYSFEEGSSNNYRENVQQNQFALFVSAAHFFPSINWRFNINLRQDFYDTFKAPFIPSVGLEGKIAERIFGKLSISRNFRIPTFNDRFWMPGGNPDLNPEKSWNGEASLIYSMDMPTFKNSTNFSITAFNSNVNNWILWIPQGIIWTAENIQEVWSRGIEIEYYSEFKLNKLRISFKGAYTYSRSTNQKKSSPNDDSFEKQLIYVPEHKYFFRGSLRYKKYLLSYYQSYTGYRYVTRDNSERLDGYSLGDISLNLSFLKTKNNLSAGFGIYNIWNVSYQSVQYNPMPGRHYKVSISYSFKHDSYEKKQPGDH